MRLMVDQDGALGLVDGDEFVAVEGPPAPPGPADPRGPLHVLLDRGALPSVRPGSSRRPLADVRAGAPLPRPGKILGAPVNYVDHQHEMREPTTVAELGLFLKAPSSVLAPGGTVRLPYDDRRTDQEAELAVVIGREARHVAAVDAFEHVAGYTCALDITVRSTEDRSTRKSFDTFTPLGPWLVTPDEVGDPSGLRLRGWVNAELRQDASTADMIFGVPELVAYASSVMTLFVGDVLVTGTPAGVGPLHDGDEVAVEIDRVGRLEVSVSGRDAVPYDRRPGQAGDRAPGPSAAAAR